MTTRHHASGRPERSSAYTLTELLHEGASTVLYRGFRSADREPIIAKLLKSEYPSPLDLARLRHEYLIARDIDAPGVVKTYGLEEIEGRLALVMEDFGGLSLSDILKTERLDPKMALQIGALVAEAVGAVHDRHIIHKDIKPHNILIDRATGQVKLIDFGIASRLSLETHRATRPDALEGTLSYMSPEQTGRMNRVLDSRTDLYSLGVTLFEMLTGTLPFAAKDPMEVVHSHIARAPPAPHERDPAIPRVVSDIVLKLLAKPAEDRYQSAHGLKADLEASLEQWGASGEIEPFPLGRKDAPLELRLAQKLYGRQEEMAALVEAFERASAGGCELLLVKGSAGVGKSALVGEIQRAISLRGALFSAGKFDQRNRNVPALAVASTFRDLVRQLLSEPAEALSAWKTNLRAAVGAQGQILTDLIPELTLIIGPQAPAPDVGPTAAQNLFGMAFRDLLRVFATREHPLVLFLDDLQWADPASLSLLTLFLSDSARGHLLIIGAYRDGEVDLGHPLSRTLEDLRKNGVTWGEISLGSLALVDVAELLRDTLGTQNTQNSQNTRDAKLERLAQLVFDKTQGNPFFIGQFLKTLHAEGWLRFNRGAGAFQWDIEGIRSAAVTDNVVELMAGKIAKLAPETQRLVMLASCIGHQFTLKTLALIAESSKVEVARGLWGALREELLLPLDPEYRFLSDPDEASGERSKASVFDVAYRFFHDRVQQAAYSLIEEAQKQAIHLRIGRLLREQCGDPEREEQLFEIIDHLNLGAALIHAHDERMDLARLNLAAGKRAKATTAYHAAAGYLQAGAALLDEGSWENAYDLTLALRSSLAECEYLSGDFEQAQSLFNVVLSRAKSRVERAHISSLLVALHTSRGDYPGALRAGSDGLAMFGIELAQDEESQQTAFHEELAALERNMAGRSIPELLDMPLLSDPEQQALAWILASLTPALYSKTRLLGWLTARQVNLALLHGHNTASPYGYVTYGTALAGILGRYREAFQFGQLALAVNERINNPEQITKVNFVFGAFINHFCEPARSSIPYFERGRQSGLLVGDFAHVGFCSFHQSMIRLRIGDNLDEIREEIERFISLAQRAKHELIFSMIIFSRQAVANLTGKTQGRHTLSDDRFDEAEFVGSLTKAGFAVSLSWYSSIKQELAFLYGDYAGAIAATARAEAGAKRTPGMYFTTDVPFYGALAIAAVYPSASFAQQERYAALLSSYQESLAALAEQCPANHLHKHRLVLAEAARIAGKHGEAWEHYDGAISAARENGFRHHEALANELAARFYQGRGNLKFADVHLREAYHGYLRWGATAKASALLEGRPNLLVRSAEGPAPVTSDLILTTTTIREKAGRFDIEAMLRAGQAIAGEIVLERLLDRLIRIVVENAGADRAVLLLARGEQLGIEATMTLHPELVQVGLQVPLEAFPDIAASVVKFVERTREPVVLSDAAGPSPFSGDAYLRAKPPRSLLCLAMIQKGRLGGILYLENHAARDAFPQSRVELTGMLASQAAIAVENALLVAGIQRRTEELSETNRALETSNERLALELSERKKAEAARALLKEELFRVQTPVIPITEQIVVMPLIGSIDEERARQVLETALRGVHATRAQVVILDVTGVDRADAAVTRMLTTTAGALRMLGARAIITGIQPEMAQVFVEPGLDLGSIVTRRTLRDGIAFAMRQSGSRLKR